MSEEFSNEDFKNSITCDSSSIISLTDSCLLHVLREIKRFLQGEYVITPAVKYECIDNALRIKQHELSALRLQQSLNRGLFTLAQPPNLEQKTQEIMQIVNNIYLVKNRPIKILQKGEVELLALNSILDIRNMLVDERTTRTLIEAPESLREHLEFEYSHSVEVNEKNLNKILGITRGLSMFRSSEILAIAYEKGLFKHFGEMEKKLLEASLYKVKFNGCGISFEEIEEHMNSLGSG